MAMSAAEPIKPVTHLTAEPGKAELQQIGNSDIAAMQLPPGRFHVITAWPDSLDQCSKALSRLGLGVPEKVGDAIVTAEGSAMRVAPGRWFFDGLDPGPAADGSEKFVITDLSNGMAMFKIHGEKATRLAQKLIMVDLSGDRPAPPVVMQTGSSHGIGLTMLWSERNQFKLFCEKSYERDFWHMLQAELAEFTIDETA
tara:strand:+ start:378 stop:971 length:594 start_codon:yes stop_codon:yes gene_type:complete